MKKIIYLFLTFVTLKSNAQINDSTVLASRILSGLNTTVFYPDGATGGIQERPCGTVMASAGPCCHSYQVICSGQVVWESAIFCDTWCLYGTHGLLGGAQINSIILATSENPGKTEIKFDMSIIDSELALTTDDILKIKTTYKEFYFDIKDDVIVKSESATIIYKKGYYMIKNGVMALNYYYTKS